MAEGKGGSKAFLGLPWAGGGRGQPPLSTWSCCRLCIAATNIKPSRLQCMPPYM